MLAIPLKSSPSMGLSAPLRVYIANEYSKVRQSSRCTPLIRISMSRLQQAPFPRTRYQQAVCVLCPVSG